jgi:hypothetical protein
MAGKPRNHRARWPRRLVDFPVKVSRRVFACFMDAVDNPLQPNATLVARRHPSRRARVTRDVDERRIRARSKKQRQEPGGEGQDPQGGAAASGAVC